METLRQYFAAALLLEDHNWDYALTVAFSTFGALVSIIAWLFKKKIDAYDKHLDECNRRAVSAGRTEERIENMECTVNWLGNCIVRIGTKMGVELPDKQDHQ